MRLVWKSAACAEHRLVARLRPDDAGGRLRVPELQPHLARPRRRRRRRAAALGGSAGARSDLSAELLRSEEVVAAGRRLARSALPAPLAQPHFFADFLWPG